MKSLIPVLLIYCLISCKAEPQPINYGKDYCQFCKMTIMEPEFAGELVTQKSKVFKFDDISCLIKYIKMDNNSEADYSHILINEFTSKTFIPVKEAHFIKDENIKSPMGGQTAAIQVNNSRETMPIQIGNEAKELNWNELKNLF